MTVVALSCITSFFITHLSSRLEEELEVGAPVCFVVVRHSARLLPQTHKHAPPPHPHKKQPQRQEWARTLRRERTKRQRRRQNAGGGEASDTEDPRRRRWGLFARRRSRREPTADDGDDSLGPREPPSMARPPSTPPPQHYHLERRLSSGFLVLAEVRERWAGLDGCWMLIRTPPHTPRSSANAFNHYYSPHPTRQDEPVDAAEYRCLLDAMSKETGDRTAYCFVKERPKGQPPEVILKSSLFSKILGPYTGEARIHHVCARVFARERSRRKRGLAAIVGSSTLVDISISAAMAAAAAAAVAATEGSASASEGGGRGVGGEGDKEKEKEGGGRRETVEEQLFKNSSLGPRAGPLRGTYFCLEERDAHPTRAGERQLFLKFYFILEREFMLAYVHVEEEEVVVGMMGSRVRSGAERGMNRSVIGKSSFFDWIDD